MRDAVTGLQDQQVGPGHERVRRAGHRLDGQGYRWLQVFTGDPLDPSRRRRALAIEPMTCPPNAFVTGTDLLILQPGDSITHTWGIRVGQS